MLYCVTSGRSPVPWRADRGLGLPLSLANSSEPSFKSLADSIEFDGENSAEARWGPTAGLPMLLPSQV
jgi:hypothetical protein